MKGIEVRQERDSDSRESSIILGEVVASNAPPS